MSPAAWRDLYEQVRANKRNARYDEVVALLRAAGWEFERQKGSHEIFQRSGCRWHVTITNANGHVRIGQVNEALKYIEECSGDEE